MTLEELRSRVGTALGVSAWKEIPQGLIDAFADVSGDHNWIHTDPVRAAVDGPADRPIAHGMLTITLVPRFVAEVLDVSLLARGSLNYGMDHVRFISPVPAGSRIRGHVSLEEVRNAGEGAHLLTFAVEVELEGTDRPACVAQLLTYLYE